MPLRRLPPRRLLAVAAAIALLGAAAPASARSQKRPASPGSTPAACPLGAFQCAPRPLSFALCRPNALLEFYDPTLTRDATGRATAATDIQAEHVDSSNQSFYKLSGNVRIERADQLLQSDRADYNDQNTDYDARGHVRYQDAGQLLAADHLRGNTEAGHGIADDVRYQLLDSHGNGSAKRGEMLDAQHTHYQQVTYSTCDVGHHLWEVRAKDLKIDKTTGVGTAHGATMRFANVPFLYLPYFTFPVDNRRKSGFLYPTFGNSSRSGLMFGIPYYLNLAPNYDATLEPRLYTSRGLLLAGEFRYLTAGSSGQLNLEYLGNDRGNDTGTSVESTKGDDRYLLKYNDYTRLVGPWAFSTSINRASDRNYLRDFGNDLYTAAIGTLASSAYVSGGGNWWSASFGADSYQNVDPYLPDTVVQYKRWPRATFNVDVPIARWLEFGANTEAVAFRKDDVVEGKRFDLYPYLAADFRGAAWFVRPKLAYRYTGYQLDNGYQNYGYYGATGGQPSPFDRQSPSRALPIASIDSGLVFDRVTSLFGQSYTQTLEPRLYYLYVPYRNQNDLPLFDTTQMSFDYWQLFSPNQYSGADRQMNANNLTAAVTTRLLDDNGVERLSASFGQIRYFTPQRVQLPGVAPTDWSGSDYVAQLGVQLNDRWRLNTDYQWNPNTHLTDLGALELQRRIGADGIVNFSYRYRRVPGSVASLLEQYDASAVYPISERWRVLGRWSYSVKEKRTVEAMAGVEYDSCCVAVRLVGRHYVNSYNFVAAQASTNNAIMFELEFKGLGAFNGQTEQFLRRGILGYQ